MAASFAVAGLDRLCRNRAHAIARRNLEVMQASRWFNEAAGPVPICSSMLLSHRHPGRSGGISCAWVGDGGERQGAGASARADK